MAKLTAREMVMAKSGEFEKGGNFRGGMKSDDFIRLKDGKNIVRVFPPKSLNPEYDVFYLERLRHFGVGPNSFPLTCPKDAAPNAQCDACDYAASIRSDDEREWNQKKAKRHYFMNAYVINPETKKLDPARGKILDAGKMIMGGIVGYYQEGPEYDGEWGDPWGEDCGRNGVAYDFVIHKSGQDLATTYRVEPTRKYQSIRNTEAILEGLVDLKEAFPQSTSEEMHAAFIGEVNEAGDIDRPEPEPVSKPVLRPPLAPRPAPKPAPKPVAKPPHAPYQKLVTHTEPEEEDLEIPPEEEDLPPEPEDEDVPPEGEVEEPVEDIEVDDSEVEDEPPPTPVRRPPSPAAPARKSPPAPNAQKSREALDAKMRAALRNGKK